MYCWWDYKYCSSIPSSRNEERLNERKLFCLFSVVLLFWDRISLVSDFGCSGAYYVDQAGLMATEIHLPLPPPPTVGTKLFSIWEKKKNLFYSFIFFKATSIDVQGGTCLWWELLWVRGRRIVSFRSVWITWWDPVLKKGHQCHARLCSAVQRSKICVSALSYFKV